MIRPGAGRWVCALLLCALPASALASPASDADLDYWYLDPYRPFFQRVEDPVRGAMMVPQRARHRASPFPRTKPPLTVRVFVIGGSVAAVYDDPQGEGDGRTLQALLERAAPGRRVEVVHCGMGGYDSHRESLIFDEVLGLDPDLIILMSGNNEMGASSGPVPLRVRTALSLRRKLGLEMAPGGSAPQLPPTEAGMDRSLARYAENLRAMARRSRRRRVALVFCTMPRQLGLPPLGPLPLRSRDFLAARLAREKGDWAKAEGSLRAHIVLNPGDPYGHLWLGECLERRGDAAGAREEFFRALEREAGRFSVPRVNQITRDAAREEGVLLADLEKTLVRRVPGARNDFWLADQMHWRRAADAAVSMTVIQALAAPGKASLALSPPVEWDRAWLSGEGRALAVPPAKAKPLSDAEFMRELDWIVMECPFRSGKAFGESTVGRFLSLARRESDRLRGVPGMKASFVSEATGNPWTRSFGPDAEKLWACGLAHLGEAWRRSGRPRLALAVFAAAGTGTGKDEAVRAHMALAELALGDRRRALELVRGLDLESDFPVAAQILGPGVVSVIARAAPMTAPQWDRKVWGSPERALLDEAFAAFSRRDWDAGFERLGRATRSWDVRRFGEFKAACASGECRPWEAATAELERLNLQGVAALDAGDRAAAESAFERSRRLLPIDAGSNINAAGLAALKGDLASALKTYDEVLDRMDASNPDYSACLLSRAEVLERLGRRRQAARDLALAEKSARPNWSGASRTAALRALLDAPAPEVPRTP